MKTQKQTSFSLAFKMVFVALACFSYQFTFAQNATSIDGQNNDSIESLVALHTPTTIKVEDDGKMVYPKFDQNNVYQDIQTYLVEEMDFPSEGIETGRSGMMKVQFQIMPDGSMQHIKFIESPGTLFEVQLKKALENAPKWIPAKKGGSDVAFTYQLNINFKLQ